MTRLALMLLTALALGGAGGVGKAADSGRLTAAQVGGVVAAMEQAAKKRDARTVASYMAEDCVITTSIPEKDGSRKVTHKDKRQYIADDATEQQGRSGYEYETATPSIEIDAAGKVAKASYKVRETFTEKGKRIQVVAYEIATVELRHGKPLITAVDVDAVAMSIDDRRVF